MERMKVYARARKPDGGVVRLKLGDAPRDGRDAALREARQEPAGGAAEPQGSSWWERWGFIRALQQSGYQRLF